MTNPSNAVEKPATGCGCEPVRYPVDTDRMCAEGVRLYEAEAATWKRRCAANLAYDNAVKAWAEAEERRTAARVEHQSANEAYRVHVEAAG